MFIVRHGIVEAIYQLLGSKSRAICYKPQAIPMYPKIRGILACATTLILTTLACNAPPLASNATPEPFPTQTQPAFNPSEPTITPTESPLLPPEKNEVVNDLIQDVSAERLYDHVQVLSAIPTRHANSPGADQAADYILSAFQTGGRLQVGVQEFQLDYDENVTLQRNVIATLPGADPNAGTIIIGAHYDSRTFEPNDAETSAPGANDNATGTAALIEMARLLSDEAFPHTIQFVAFAAEEVGAWGARTYLSRAQAEGRPIEAVIILDIVGNSAGPQGENTIRLFATPPAEGDTDSSSRALARTLDYTAGLYLPAFDVQMQPTIDRPGRYSDHVPFGEAGIPAVRFIELIEDTNRQHSEFDQPQFVSLTYLRTSTQLALLNTVSLASGLPVPTQIDEGSEILTWSPEEVAAAYVVALRTEEDLEPTEFIRTIEPALPLEDVSNDFQFAGIAVVDETGIVGLFSPEYSLKPLAGVRMYWVTSS